MFLAAVLRPDGLMPQIGDADDGRLHIFSDYGTWRPQDARHICSRRRPRCSTNRVDGAPAIRGGRGKRRGGDSTARRATAAESAPARRSSFRRRPRGDPATRALSARSRTARVGTNGFGNHKHNDLLSFEYHVDGTPLIVDPGSYVYTSNPDARNLFRSTASHNTLIIDDEEQNEFKPEWLFRMFESANPEHLEFVVDADAIRYRGRHNGYARLPQPVVHERSFELEHGSGVLQIARSTDRRRQPCAGVAIPSVRLEVERDDELDKARCPCGPSGHAWLLRSLDESAGRQ